MWSYGKEPTYWQLCWDLSQASLKIWVLLLLALQVMDFQSRVTHVIHTLWSNASWMSSGGKH
jgi:hypothetical protein